MNSILRSLHQGFNLIEIKLWSQTSAYACQGIFHYILWKKIDPFLQ
jgi:hypothetical protein